MNHLSLSDPLSQASDGVVAAHLSVVTFATKSAPRNTPLPRTHQGSEGENVAIEYRWANNQRDRLLDRQNLC